MSELTYLEKLLDGVKVEWQTLGKVLKRTKGTKITAGQMKALHKDNAPLKIFAGGKTVAFVDFKDIPEKDINREPSIIVKSRGIIEFEYYDKPFSHKNEMWSYHSNNDAISIKYIYYFLKINEGYFQKIGGKMQMPQIATPDTDKFEVPIPCPDNPEKSLAIQSEIVRILDKFTALTAELTAELNMRKKQYNHYRDLLLSFEEGEVEWKMLGDLGENLDSKRKPITSGLREAGSIPYYGASGIVDYVKDYIFDGDFLLISEDGANLLARNTPIAFSISGKSWVNNHAHVIKFDSYAERRYVEYYLNSIDLAPYISGAAQPKLNKKNLESIRIPNPSPEDKERIVSILDKFDALTNSINEGLPREIELRQKQYEYYRDLLFSFPRPETASN
ncbi:TPA: restriction endonuclease subunit S [Salmonella enterica]|uniref:restriction endonuclease subunit S n=1 Tax=Salmonella enterica TaxID=28901 RepID=UPI00234C7AB8|nr:restriction endonuclease subunit S [Salmonella enterica]MDJ4671302.1 restriction endonuclease subunit S [Salmonella enterica]MDJ4710823.1 restriction endonuclease subunit S [Salmonella enterica]MDJ5057442.1 restriction endonuclease subunit S [Salmonella enterica]MDJ7768682.1 restriction endonuclease subunit S [Salmonella enterica]MDJ7776102.1 restriction endonuclease subunit S [Salmonella enterica]